MAKANTSRFEEKAPGYLPGMPVLLFNIAFMVASVVVFGNGIAISYSDKFAATLMVIPSLVYLFVIGPILFAGLKVLKPNEALVLTLFGKYIGTLKKEGFYAVNPFSSAVNPAAEKVQEGDKSGGKPTSTGTIQVSTKKTISLKVQTLNNDKQKINDALGNPIIIGIVVVWKIVDTVKAVFNVDNYAEYLSIQCDSALRNIVRLYPYDSDDEEQEKSLRGSSQDLAIKLKEEIQEKVGIAGIEILEARITHLSYAPEIAAAMLQRQQASAVVAARQLIVEGAVGMVEMALDKLSVRKIVDLDEERKAAMVSNLLVVLCGGKDPQPVVNTGTIY